MRGKKKTIEEVRLFIEEQGYEWVYGRYENTSSKLGLQCQKKHEFEMIWNSFYNVGYRCPFCAGNKRKLPEEIRKFIENQGYKWVSGEYQNAFSKLELECPKKHLFKTTWSDFHSIGSRCPFCAVDKKRKTSEEVQKFIESQGYKWVFGEYKNCRSKLWLRCPKGHLWEVNWNDFQQGVRCSFCAYINISINMFGPNNPNWKGGIQYDPYCPIWNGKELKEIIKVRDRYT